MGSSHKSSSSPALASLDFSDLNGRYSIAKVSKPRARISSLLELTLGLNLLKELLSRGDKARLVEELGLRELKDVGRLVFVGARSFLEVLLKVKLQYAVRT